MTMSKAERQKLLESANDVAQIAEDVVCVMLPHYSVSAVKPGVKIKGGCYILMIESTDPDGKRFTKDEFLLMPSDVMGLREYERDHPIFDRWALAIVKSMLTAYRRKIAGDIARIDIRATELQDDLHNLKQMAHDMVDD